MERPKSGEVVFDGARIDGLPGHAITAKGIAYVPENKRLFPRLSVADNLRLGSYLHRKEADREAPLERVFSLFPRLKERLPQRAGTLSGGEQQMLAIGRALMTRPRLLMLDEPSQGIMPKLVDEIFSAIEAIRASGTTILLVEQRLAESLSIADRAYVLQTGRLMLSGRRRPAGRSGGEAGLSGDLTIARAEGCLACVYLFFFPTHDLILRCQSIFDRLTSKEGSQNRRDSWSPPSRLPLVAPQDEVVGGMI